MHEPSPLRESLSDFSVELGFFSGPMDLLLHLVHQQEVSVEQVEMAVVAEQYLQVIANARYLDLERASEYLVIAATLVAIKSHRLLPGAVVEGENGQESGEGEAFYEELRRRLAEYEQTKQRAVSLLSLPQIGVDVFKRVGRVEVEEEGEVEVGWGASALGAMFLKLMKRIGDGGLYYIRREAISVVSFMMKLVDLGQLPRIGGWTFMDAAREIFKRRENKAQGARGVVIGSFIGLLELMKRGLTAASQSSESDEITVAWKLAGAGGDTGKGEVAADGLSSEFDTVPSAEILAVGNS